MAAGKISIQANDGKVAGVVFEDGASSNVTVTVPKDGGKLAADSLVVHKTGDETITGVKTFNNNTVMNGTVGIGTQNPVETVDVVGNIRASIVYGSRSSAAAVASGGLGVSIDGNLQCEIVSPSSSTMAVLTGGYERMRIDSSGNVLVTGSGGLGYGTGSGGTVTQLTSKSTTVTLNKPCGKITMNNAALAAGGIVEFVLQSSYITVNDNLVVNCNTNALYYRVSARTTTSAAVIQLENRTASSLSESVEINFSVIKGATA